MQIREDDGKAKPERLLRVENLRLYFKAGRGREIKAVDGVSFDIGRGEVFGLVGESGCGKTTTGRSIIKLYDITGGNVYFKGQRISAGTLDYKENIAKAKERRRAAVAKLKERYRQRLSSEPDNAENIRAEYAAAVSDEREAMRRIVAEQKRLISAARDDKKNCEKKYLKKLTAEYREKVAEAGSSAGLGEDEARKFRAVENLPKIPKICWQIAAVLLFLTALALLVSCVAVYARFKAEFGGFVKAGAIVTACDEAANTTTVVYSVGGTEYEKVFGFYDPALDGGQNVVRTDIYYDKKDPARAEIKKPSSPLSAALLAAFLASAATGFAVTLYVNERYNPARLVTQIQMIFQDPVASLDPRMTVRDVIAEGLVIGGEKDKKHIDEKVYEALGLVGLLPEHAGRYPHEFSGGQRQRIGVARAVIMQPELIIADEPVSALDVSVQAQVINLLNDLREKLKLTILFIAHDLSVVRYFSDRIGVMYLGKLVEVAESDELFAHPMHPYTRALLSAIPVPDPETERGRKRIVYDPSVHDYSADKPEMREITEGHFVFCNAAEEQKLRREINESGA